MSEQFAFKEVDQEGMETLNVVAEADRFNTWMYETIKPFCTGRILEIGSGIGNISDFFINDNQQLTLSDIRQNYVDILRKKHEGKPNLNEVMLLDIIDPDFDKKFAAYFETFDSIYALNIVEHVADDKLAIANMRKLLKPGGNMVILVPAYQKLYNVFDKELEHYRRYTLKQLDGIMRANELEVIHHQYFNFIGIFGWWFSGSVLKKKTIPGGQMKLYNKLVPVFKVIDQIIGQAAGLSVISVGRK
jgi:2-polyprenyl-3-methyl-5-hydroxy-6-metoxy-1,4-benzoquinol methylase